MQKKEILISVIIPVYKVEPYLRQCVESVLAQTYHNLEIILVDDGSPDVCGTICEEYAARDSRIRVIHQENSGMAHARNSGLNIAEGDYITFVDSDDFIHPRYVEVLVGNAIKSDALVSCVDFAEFQSDEEVQANPNPMGKIYCENNRDYLQALLYQTTGNSAVWGKLFSASLFKAARFREGIWYEDLELLSRLLLTDGSTVWCNDRLYYYRRRPDSSMHSFESRRLDVLEVTEAMVRNYAAKYPQLLDAARSRRLSASFNIYCLSVANGSKDRELEHRCAEVIRSERRKFLFDKNIRWKNRLGILITYIAGFRLLRLLATKIYRHR